MTRPIAVFTSNQAAQNLSERLAETGIPVLGLHQEETTDADGHGMQLTVIHPPEESIGLLTEHIARLQNTSPELFKDAITCPECGSITVEFPSRSLESATLGAIEEMVDEITEKLVGGTKTFHCNTCDYDWQAREM